MWTFVRLQLLNVYRGFNVLSATGGMPSGLQYYSAICIMVPLSDG